MGRKFEIVVIALMVVCMAGTGMAIGHQKNKVDKLRSDSVAALEKSVSVDDYRKAQKKQVEDILSKYEKDLSEVRTQEEADKLLSAAKDEIKPIKTDKQLTRIEKKKAEEKAKKEAAKRAAEKKAAEEAAAAAEAAQQAEQESYNYSNQGNSGRNSSGGGGNNSQSDNCVDPKQGDSIWN